MDFGGWSTWQVVTLIFCIAVAISYSTVVGKRKKNTRGIRDTIGPTRRQKGIFHESL